MSLFDVIAFPVPDNMKGLDHIPAEILQAWWAQGGGEKYSKDHADDMPAVAKHLRRHILLWGATPQERFWFEYKETLQAMFKDWFHKNAKS